MNYTKYNILMEEAEKLWNEHYDSFTYMGENPYSFNYFLEIFHPEIVDELERLEGL